MQWQVDRLKKAMTGAAEEEKKTQGASDKPQKLMREYWAQGPVEPQHVTALNQRFELIRQSLAPDLRVNLEFDSYLQPDADREPEVLSMTMPEPVADAPSDNEPSKDQTTSAEGKPDSGEQAKADDTAKDSANGESETKAESETASEGAASEQSKTETESAKSADPVTESETKSESEAASESAASAEHKTEAEPGKGSEPTAAQSGGHDDDASAGKEQADATGGEDSKEDGDANAQADPAKT